MMSRTLLPAVLVGRVTFTSVFTIVVCFIRILVCVERFRKYRVCLHSVIGMSIFSEKKYSIQISKRYETLLIDRVLISCVIIKYKEMFKKGVGIRGEIKVKNK